MSHLDEHGGWKCRENAQHISDWHDNDSRADKKQLGQDYFLAHAFQEVLHERQGLAKAQFLTKARPQNERGSHHADDQTHRQPDQKKENKEYEKPGRQALLMLIRRSHERNHADEVKHLHNEGDGNADDELPDEWPAAADEILDKAIEVEFGVGIVLAAAVH